MIKIEFTKEEVEQLFKEKVSNPHSEIRRKAEVLYLKSLKLSHGDIQSVTRISRTTLANYLKGYKKEGLKWVTANNHYSPKSKLEEYTQLIKEYFEKHPPASSKQAATNIKELTSLSRSPTQVRAFLKKIGMRFRKTGFVPGSQNRSQKVEEQEAFLKKNLNPS